MLPSEGKVSAPRVEALAISEGLACETVIAGVSTVDCRSEDNCIWLGPVLYTGDARYVDNGPAWEEVRVTICEMEGCPSLRLEAKLLRYRWPGLWKVAG